MFGMFDKEELDKINRLFDSENKTQWIEKNRWLAIARKDVAGMDFEGFDRIWKSLKSNRNAIRISFSGWDNDPRALHYIPEVRKFVSGLLKRYPTLYKHIEWPTGHILALCIADFSCKQGMHWIISNDDPNYDMISKLLHKHTV